MARRKDISVTIKDEEEFLKYYDENYPKLVGFYDFYTNYLTFVKF